MSNEAHIMVRGVGLPYYRIRRVLVGVSWVWASERGVIMKKDATFHLIVKTAFEAGEEWALTYHTWFEPTEQDCIDRLEQCKTKIRKLLEDRS